jgi:hypothetical protein
MAAETRVPGSFRDPSGFLYERAGRLYRQVNRTYQEDYQHLVCSGLLARLVKENLLVAHDEVSVEPAEPASAYKVIAPVRLPFISYPYEWCFSQLKDAALATLRIQTIALEHGMILKDASAYNIQFTGGGPILLDTLSFQKYREGEPWVAYRQFCQHFLAPLALMVYTDVRMGQLMRVFIDGVPLDLASRLLPVRTRMRFGLMIHLHLHAAAQRHYAGKTSRPSRRKMPRTSLLGLVSSLTSSVTRLKWSLPKTEWGEYYNATNYSVASMDAKKKTVATVLERIKPDTVWDLGANTGEFSQVAARYAATTVAFDIDPVAVERNYLDCRGAGGTILPLLMDLTNPSPAQGWRHEERMSLETRGPADCALALALVHHLAISNNVPLGNLAAFFACLCRHLVIEFVPKEDSQVRRLLSTREDVFPEYDQGSFERAFGTLFDIREAVPVAQSSRTLYWMSKKA